MPSNSTLGTSLGTLGGTLLGYLVPGIGPGLGAFAGGMLGNLFSGGPRQIDITPYVKEWESLAKKADQFLNPNSDYYAKAFSNVKKSMLDVMMTSARSKIRDLAAQGIVSNALVSQLKDEAAVQASDKAASEESAIYRWGAQIGERFSELASSVGNAISQIEKQNADTINSFENSLLTMGAGLLGQTFLQSSLGKQLASIFAPDKIAEPKADTTAAATKPISTAPVEQPTINFSTPFTPYGTPTMRYGFFTTPDYSWIARQRPPLWWYTVTSNGGL